jgi:hypothetical protein
VRVFFHWCKNGLHIMNQLPHEILQKWRKTIQRTFCSTFQISRIAEASKMFIS